MALSVLLLHNAPCQLMIDSPTNDWKLEDFPSIASMYNKLSIHKISS